MTEPRQRNIPLNINERRELDRRKEDYETQTGDVGDWGKFLGIATLAGLAALGIYAVGRAIKQAPTEWQVNCSLCSTRFPIQVPNPPPWRVAQVTCPKCDAELVIDFARPASSVSNEHEPGTDGAYTAYCHHCQQQIQITFSKVNPQGVEYLRCGNCGQIGTYALLGVE